MPLWCLQQIKATLHAGEHAQSQTIDLHEFQNIDIVLIPFDNLPVCHGGGLDRHQFVEPVTRQHKAARMLREMPRRADQRARQINGEFQAAVFEVEVQLLGMLRLDPLLRPAPDLGVEQGDHIFRKSKHFADIAQRALGAIADHGRAKCGVIAAIGLEHPLHDDLAPLVLEIDIDIRRFAPLLRDKALEQQVVAFRINRGDAKHIAYRAIGGRTSPLAENVLAAGETHDGIHRQKIRRVV